MILPPTPFRHFYGKNIEKDAILEWNEENV
jgi:hypothetical protein